MILNRRDRTRESGFLVRSPRRCMRFITTCGYDRSVHSLVSHMLQGKCVHFRPDSVTLEFVSHRVISNFSDFSVRVHVNGVKITSFPSNSAIQISRGSSGVLASVMRSRFLPSGSGYTRLKSSSPTIFLDEEKISCHAATARSST